MTNFPGKCDWWCWLDLLPCGCSLYWVVTLICAYECSALTCNSSANANSGTFFTTSRGQNAMLLLLFKTCVSAIILVVWICRYYNQNTQFSSILQYSNYVCNILIDVKSKIFKYFKYTYVESDTCLRSNFMVRNPEYVTIFSSLVCQTPSVWWSTNSPPFSHRTPPPFYLFQKFWVLRLRFSPKKLTNSC